MWPVHLRRRAVFQGDAVFGRDGGQVGRTVVEHANLQHGIVALSARRVRSQSRFPWSFRFGWKAIHSDGLKIKEFALPVRQCRVPPLLCCKGT